MPRRSASLSKSATMRCQTRRRWYSNNLRLQVWGDARMSCGRSSQRHPVCKTYKIPLSTSRSSSRGRPVRAGRGTRRLIRSHWASVTSERYGLRGMPSNVARHEFRQQLPFCNPENRTSLGVFGVLRQPHLRPFKRRAQRLRPGTPERGTLRDNDLDARLDGSGIEDNPTAEAYPPDADALW